MERVIFRGWLIELVSRRSSAGTWRAAVRAGRLGDGAQPRSLPADGRTFRTRDDANLHALETAYRWIRRKRPVRLTVTSPGR